MVIGAATAPSRNLAGGEIPFPAHPHGAAPVLPVSVLPLSRQASSVRCGPSCPTGCRPRFGTAGVPTGTVARHAARSPIANRKKAQGRLERRSPTGIARQRETRTDDAGHPNLTVERRSPTGIARQRETRTDNPGHPNLTARSAGLRPASRGSAKPAPTTLATPISRPRGSAKPATPISRWSAGLRPASRGSAKPAPTTLATPISRWSAGLRPASRGSAKPAPTTLATPISRPGAPVSDRHRAAARNPHRRRWPPQSHGGAPVSDRHRAAARNPHRRRWPPQSHGGAPVSDRHRAAARNPHRRRWPPQSHGLERRSPTGIARQRETRTDDAGHPNLTAWSASLRPASRGSAKPAPTTLATPISRLGAPEWPLSWPHQPALRSCRQPKPEPRRGDVMNPFHPGGVAQF